MFNAISLEDILTFIKKPIHIGEIWAFRTWSILFSQIIVVESSWLNAWLNDLYRVQPISPLTSTSMSATSSSPSASVSWYFWDDFLWKLNSWNFVSSFVECSIMCGTLWLLGIFLALKLASEESPSQSDFMSLELLLPLKLGVLFKCALESLLLSLLTVVVLRAVATC